MFICVTGARLMGASAPAPSPGTPGEGGGEGFAARFEPPAIAWQVQVQGLLMIPPAQANMVFFSALLKTRYPTLVANITALLNEHHVAHEFIDGTRDIWCRDYMPVQIDTGRFLQFTYA